MPEIEVPIYFPTNMGNSADVSNIEVMIEVPRGWRLLKVQYPARDVRGISSRDGPTAGGVPTSKGRSYAIQNVNIIF